MVPLPGTVGDVEGQQNESAANRWVTGTLESGAEYLRPHEEEDMVEELVPRTSVEGRASSYELLQNMPARAPTRKLQNLRSTGRLKDRSAQSRWSVTQPFNRFLQNVQSISNRGVRGAFLPRTTSGQQQ